MAEYEAQCERYRQQEQLAAHYQGAALHDAHHHHHQHHHNSHAGARAGAFAGAGAGAGHGGGGNFSETDIWGQLARCNSFFIQPPP